MTIREHGPAPITETISVAGTTKIRTGLRFASEHADDDYLTWRVESRRASGDYVSAADSTFGMSGQMCAIWFGILVVKMAELCLITPPIGLNCFVIACVRDDLTVHVVFRGVTPFFIADALTIIILVMYPSIELWLPSQVG